MSGVFEAAYRVGVTPWEWPPVRAALVDAAGLDRGAPASGARALDIGCGSGGSTIALAQRGWDAVGIDNVRSAIRSARSRTDADTDTVTFIEGDATRLRSYGVADIDFFLDIGCFHGLTDPQRRALAAEVTAAAAVDATLVIVAFRPGRRMLLPRGAGESEITTAFVGWQLTEASPVDPKALPWFIRRAAPVAYRLRRRD